MIYCVWYPSGGFGHFVNAVLTLHGDNFVRPKKSLTFSPTGDSHSLDLILPKYFHECWTGGLEFVDNQNYCVLVDNGINNTNSGFKSTFPNATVIKICYSDYSWPVVARTMIEKAMQSSIEEQLPTDQWDSTEPWTRREKYFLYLRDHPLRHAWNSQNKHTLLDTELDVAELYQDYEECHSVINAIAKTEDFCTLWKEWRLANSKYIDPVITAKTVLCQTGINDSVDLTHITDIWTQAVVYYYIWVRYRIEVPHNDYANWFTNTSDIVKMLKEHRVDSTVNENLPNTIKKIKL
jgi:hypothetical protein